VKQKIVILGGGAGGLSAGWMLSRSKKYDVTVIEKESAPGGVCATFRYGDFSLDYGPHKFYSVIPGIQDEIKTLMGGEFITHEKKNSIYLFDSYLKYPLSMAELALKMGPKNILETALSMVSGKFKKKKRIASYEDYIIDKFGTKLYSLVFEPLASKTWGEPSTLSADIARTRIPSKGFAELLLRVAGLKKEDATTDASHFLYPRDGFGRITDRMAEELAKNGGTLLTSSEVTGVSAKAGTVTGVRVGTGGAQKTVPCDLLISSLPLPSFTRLLPSMDDFESASSVSLADNLQSRTVYLVYLFVKSPRLTSDHWIFFPGREVIFGRVFEQKNLSGKMAPDDRTAICCDFTDDNGGPLSRLSDAELAGRCEQALKKVRILGGETIEGHAVRRFGGFYPRYGIDYKTNLSNLFLRLKSFKNLLLTGRVGFYNYNNLDHCVDMGRFIAENLAAGRNASDIWDLLRERVENYRIVD